MSRRKVSSNRKILPDLLYNSELVSKFINILMVHGKKTVAECIFYTSLDIIEKTQGKNKLELLEKAINNVKPVIEVKSRRVGGTTYQIPVEVRPIRSITLAIRWIILGAKNRKGKKMSLKLANEILEALDHKGFAFKKKEDVHRMAESNKAFAHYRW